MIHIVTAYSSPHQNQHAVALAQGLSQFGIQGKIVPTILHAKSNVVACWGWRIGKKLRDLGKEVLVMERGYIGDRFHYTSMGWNGLNNYADFPDYPDDQGERFKSHGGILRPWKEKGFKNCALILGQVPGDASLKGKDMVPWYEEVAEKIKDIHRIPVFFRPHPDLKRKGIYQEVKGTIKSEFPFSQALNSSNFTACWNSNSAVDSVLNGTPCYVGDEGTMAWDVCSKDLSDIKTFDREKWAYSLAFKQWSIEEIISGQALLRLGIQERLLCA